MIKYAITDPLYYQNLSYAFCHYPRLKDADFLLLRDKNAKDYFALACEFMKFKQVFKKTKFILQNDIKLAILLNADGLHFSSNNICAIKNAPQNMLKIASTHNDDEIILACESGADFITFSPIFECNKGAPKGIDALKKAVKLASDYKVKTLGLGGVNNASKIAHIKSTKCAGFAGISYFVSG